MTKQKMWMGNPPKACDICTTAFTTCFIDGKTTSGPWANMCVGCHKRHGCGLGLGKGQRYDKNAEGQWIKAGG